MRNFTDSSIIGILDLGEELINEVTIKSKNGDYNPGGLVGECNIEIRNNEGTIPHFHIISKNNKYECCVCIYSNQYFNHNNKHNLALNNKQRKLLDEWLRSDNKSLASLIKDNTKDKSNWKFICDEWWRLNNSCLFPKNQILDKQPDYSDMASYKSE